MAAPLPRFNPKATITQTLRLQNNNAENAARLGFSFGQYDTNGWGEFEAGDAITFDSPFVYQPSVMYGAAFQTYDEAAKLVPSKYPWSFGTVIHWDQDVNGFWRGAHVVVTVFERNPFIAPPLLDTEPNYALTHFFTFLGIMLKDIPSYQAGNESEN